MGSAIIIGNGQFPRKEYPLYVIRQAERIVCCDGALVKFLARSEAIFGYRRIPDAVIGDMDSLPASLRKSYEGTVINCPDQETNDQTKAFNHVLDNYPEITEIHFIGATGLREDHTIGNISLLMEYARERDLEKLGITVDMISDHGTIFPVTDTVELQCGKGRRVSVFTPDNTLRIRSEGLVWPTDGVVFDNWWKATLNRAAEDCIKLIFSHKSIAIVMLD